MLGCWSCDLEAVPVGVRKEDKAWELEGYWMEDK